MVDQGREQGSQRPGGAGGGPPAIKHTFPVIELECQGLWGPKNEEAQPCPPGAHTLTGKRAVKSPVCKNTAVSWLTTNKVRGSETTFSAGTWAPHTE